MDPEVFAQARLRMDQLTKPPRALGYLEEVALRLAALQGRCLLYTSPSPRDS